MLKLNATTTLPMLVLCATSLSPVQSAHAAGSPPPLVQSLCQNCHGEYGVAVMPGAANLSGQQHEYIREQLRAYRAGRRESPHMSVIAKSLSDDDIDQLADWYSSIKVTVETPQ